LRATDRAATVDLVARGAHAVARIRALAPGQPEFERINPLIDPRWSEFVCAAPAATAFHHRAWLALLARQYRYELFACCLTDRDGQIQAGVPLARVASRLTGTRLVSLPFSDVVPPLYRADSGPRLELELSRALCAESARQRVSLDLHAPWTALAGSYESGRFWHHTVALGRSFDELESETDRACRKNLRKARRAGVVVSVRTDEAALDAFYRLHAQTRHRQGVPIQPRRFIRGFAELFAQDLGFVMLAQVGTQVIAGAVLLRWNGTLIYKYSASDRSEQGKRPVDLMTAEAIRFGSEQGLHTFDFGRTDVDNPGLRTFKLKWGAQEHRLAYTKLSHAPGQARAKHTPRPLAKLSQLQHAAIRTAPPAFGRLVGQVLYRHFA